MRREAQPIMGGIEQVRFKKEEIGQRLKIDLAKLRTLINPNMSPSQIAVQMNAIITPMAEFVNKKVLELVSLKSSEVAGTTQPAAAKDGHLGPRGIKQNKKLPDFWRRNLDYGDSPYMHMDELKTITDRKISKRKRKKLTKDKTKR